MRNNMKVHCTRQIRVDRPILSYSAPVTCRRLAAVRSDSTPLDRSLLINCSGKSHLSNSSMEVASDVGMGHPTRICAAAQENCVVATNEISVVRQMLNHVHSSSAVDGN